MTSVGWEPNGFYRKQTACPCCGASIGLGHVMCSRCFREPQAPGHKPYKYWRGPWQLGETAYIRAWLEYTRKATA